MKKLIRIVLVVMIMLSVHTLTADADRGGHGGHGGYRGYGGYGGHGGHSHVGVGVVIGPGWWPGWWGSYPYYPYYPYYPQPPVVIREPELYVQPTPEADNRYWYYCPGSRGYYPDVKKCPQGWLKVLPPAGKE